MKILVLFMISILVVSCWKSNDIKVNVDSNIQVIENDITESPDTFNLMESKSEQKIKDDFLQNSKKDLLIEEKNFEMEEKKKNQNYNIEFQKMQALEKAEIKADFEKNNIQKEK